MLKKRILEAIGTQNGCFGLKWCQNGQKLCFLAQNWLLGLKIDKKRLFWSKKAFFRVKGLLGGKK